MVSVRSEAGKDGEGREYTTCTVSVEDFFTLSPRGLPLLTDSPHAEPPVVFRFGSCGFLFRTSQTQRGSYITDEEVMRDARAGETERRAG